jgi:hypothetical protein
MAIGITLSILFCDKQLATFIYLRRLSVAKKAFQKIEECLQRDELLPKYCVRIPPQPV